ncbi:MAG: IclR family transcriptional regulator [Anaerolineae bacterium]|nr:IclR family transcriptional regulator [Anaerolineae bacterium]
MSITAVERALVILKQMAFSANGVGVRELARSLALSPAVVQKSLQALVAQGFAYQDPATQQYHLGAIAIQVGLAGLAKLEIRAVARPYLEALADSTGETVFLGIRQENVAVYVDKVLSRAEIRLDAPIGSRRPFNCTAVGKALLAYMPANELEQLAVSGAFARSTPHSIVDVEALKAEMTQIQAQGVAFDRQEYALGAMCLAAPVRNHEGAVVAAITVTGPVQRIEAAQYTLVQQVIQCASEISMALGYRLTPVLA